MAYTTIAFAGFVFITMLVYFLFPIKKYQWTVLLVASYFFYLYNGYKYAFYIIFTTLTIYAAAMWINNHAQSVKATAREMKADHSRDEVKEYRARAKRSEKRVVALTLIANFGILVFLKYYNFMVGGLYQLFGQAPADTPFLKLFLPLGISFYTFQATGYLIDVYRETTDPERNLLKFALFVSFFPQIVQGPISEFGQLGPQLVAPHKPEWMRFKLGMELIIYGLFKKIVIADRLVKSIDLVCQDYDKYNGFLIFIAACMYAIQIYADFSGGIDISRGVARILGIDLTLNFRRPYFSKSLAEYWRRWHITLGAWMKKYVFYSLSMSSLFMNWGRAIKKGGKPESKLRAHLARTLPPSVATFVVFMLVGIWHGANSRYIGFGLWNGLVLTIAMLLKPVFEGMNKALHIKTESFLWKVFQMIRTFALVLVGYYFDIAKSFTAAIDMIWRSCTDINVSLALQQFYELPFGLDDYLALLVSCSLLFLFGIITEIANVDSPEELISRWHPIIQWLFIFFAIATVLTFGLYGEGYDPSSFVYMQF